MTYLHFFAFKCSWCIVILAVTIVPIDAIVVNSVYAGGDNDNCSNWDFDTSIPEMDMVSSGMHGSFSPWLPESECFTEEEQIKLFGSTADVKVGSNQTKFNAIFSLSFYSFLDAKLKGRKISRLLLRSEDVDFRIVAHSQGIRYVLEGLYGYARMTSQKPGDIKRFKLLFVAPRTTGGYMKRTLFKILKCSLTK